MKYDILKLKADTNEAKILELSNSIDFWEREYLLNPNGGYYSLHGEIAISKSSDYLSELDKFANDALQKIAIENDAVLLEFAKNVKNKKVDTISKGISIHKYNETISWIKNTFNEAQNNSISKGVAYRNDLKAVEIALNNGKTVTKQKANFLKINQEELLNEFLSHFHTEILFAYLKEENILARSYFNKYKNEIREDYLEIFENAVSKCEIKKEANELALHFAQLDEFEANRNINAIKNEDLKNLTKSIYEIYFFEAKNQPIVVKRELINNSWKKVKNSLSVMDVNFALDENVSKNQLQYIEEMKKYGEILTNANVYLDLRDLSIYNTQDFLNLDLITFSHELSENDLKIFENRQKNVNSPEFSVAKEDGFLIDKELQNLELSDKQKYEIIKSIENDFLYFEKLNKKLPSREDRKRIIFEKIAEVSRILNEQKSFNGKE